MNRIPTKRTILRQEYLRIFKEMPEQELCIFKYLGPEKTKEFKTFMKSCEIRVNRIYDGTGENKKPIKFRALRTVLDIPETFVVKYD